MRPGRLHTFFPELRHCLAKYVSDGDNQITELSLGYRVKLGNGWDMPAGVLPAPASPNFFNARFMPSIREGDATLESAGYIQHWIVYRASAFSTKELTVGPGASVVITDSAAYGAIAVQGRGTLGVWNVETPTLIRYGRLTHDDFFVCESAAQTGVVIKNSSDTEPLVLLKHFGPGNPDLPSAASADQVAVQP